MELNGLEQHTDQTFETLVVGESNMLAYSAALQMATARGCFQCLFISGGQGTGRTHLMYAIANRMLQQDSDAQIKLISAQVLIELVRQHQFESFREYFCGLDLLLIDDIHFKPSDESGLKLMHDELAAILEKLCEARKKVVMTSDLDVNALDIRNHRLASIIRAGTQVVVTPPDMNMRRAIVLEKANKLQMTLSEEIAAHLASYHETGRELQGAVQKLKAFALTR